MTSLMLRTPSNSFCKRALRFCSVSYLETPLREWGASVLSEGGGPEGLVCFEVRDGDANRSSASDESSERPSLPVFGVAMLLQVNTSSATALEEFFPPETRSSQLLDFITNNRVPEVQISAQHPPPSARINSHLRPSDKRAAQLAQPRAGGPEGGNKVRSKPPHLFDRDQTLRPRVQPPSFLALPGHHCCQRAFSALCSLLSAPQYHICLRALALLLLPLLCNCGRQSLNRSCGQPAVRLLAPYDFLSADLEDERGLPYSLLSLSRLTTSHLAKAREYQPVCREDGNFTFSSTSVHSSSLYQPSHSNHSKARMGG